MKNIGNIGGTMFKINEIFNIFKGNKKLLYAVNTLILILILSFILKFDTSKNTDNPLKDLSKENDKSSQEIQDTYAYHMERRIKEIIGKIEGINSVDVMIYTKNTAVMEPVYEENTGSESNIEVGSDGTKREVKRDTKQNQVVKGNNNQVVEKYYQFPEISGVLIVVNYTGNKNINSILLNSVKTLLNIPINDIEVVLTN